MQKGTLDAFAFQQGGQWWGGLNSSAPVSPVPGQKAVGGASWGFAERPVSAPVRCCPPFTCRLRTQDGPTEGSWSRMVADPFGAPILRTKGRIGRPGTARPIASCQTRGVYASQLDDRSGYSEGFIHYKLSVRNRSDSVEKGIGWLMR